MEFLKTKQLRDQTLPELETLLIDVKGWLFEAKNKQRQEDQMKQPHMISEARRCIARIKTVLNEKTESKVC